MKKIVLGLLIVVAAHWSFANNVKVTNTLDSGPGSLREALNTANADSLIDTILFRIPISDPGFDTSRGVFRIEITSNNLPTIHAHNLVIDGCSQTAFTGNTNTALLGRGGLVGCHGDTLSTLDGPEVEIVDKGNLKVGFNINGDNIVICGFAVYGFGKKEYFAHANIVICPTRYNVRITKNVIGASATSFTAPAGAEVNGAYNIGAGDGDSVIIENNLIGYAKYSGIYVTNYKSKISQNWTIDNNEIISNGVGKSNQDGITLVNNTKNVTISGNYIGGNSGNGIDTWQGTGEWVIDGNTVTENGKAANETAGIRIFGFDSEVSSNSISSNYGAGVMVTSGASQTKISQNCMCDNGYVTGNSGQAATQNIGIDVLYSTENEDKGNAPYYTLNDEHDFDLGGNGALNFPVMESCELLNGDLIVKGWTRPQSEVEIFKGCVPNNAVFPQGEEFIAAFTEGSGDDASSAISWYGPGPVQGLGQGKDSTNRFSFTITAPVGIQVGSVITSTATLNNNTSEFSGACVVTQALSKISPVLECVYPDTNGSYTAVFGYNNPNNTVVNLAIGGQNEFVPAPQNQGQPTAFQPGRQWDVFEVNFNGSNLVWKLDGKTATASSSSPQCPFDIAVAKSVSNSAPNSGDTIEFTVEVSNQEMKTMTNVEIYDELDPNLTFLSYTATHGTYDVNNGKWTIPVVMNGDTASMSMVVIADSTAENLACLTASDQVDGNAYNNCAVVAVCVKNTSGGNNGGLESNGHLASLVANRNYQRQVRDEDDFYANVSQLPVFSHTNTAVRAGQTSLEDYLPETGPNGTQAKITTPTDLIGISNANEVFSVDYFDKDRRLGAILAINSKDGEVYEHTKVICDRLNGGRLTNLRHELIAGRPFIMAKIQQENGDLDYAVSFVALKKANGTFSIDNRWNIEEYQVEASDSVFNFQVWSIAPNETRKMVENILQRIDGKGYMRYLNNWAPTIPTVYVESASYHNGNLEMIVHNDVQAAEVFISGNRSLVENGDRLGLDTNITLTSIGGSSYQANVEAGYLFDAGFSLSNDRIGGRDILYVADGPWGTDFVRNTGAKETKFEVTEHDTTYLNVDDYPVERGVEVEGEVQTYYSVFKTLKVGNRPVDVNAYNQIVFQASATGVKEMELVVSRASVGPWKDQFRVKFPVEDGMKEYRVGFPLLTSSDQSLQFDAEDVLTFTFVMEGDYQAMKPFSLKIDQVKLDNDFVSALVEEQAQDNHVLRMYPNPTTGMVQFNLETQSPEKVNIRVFDMQGKQVQSLGDRNLVEGMNNFIEDLSGLENGAYVLSVEGPSIHFHSQLIIRK
ncbi:DUF11 domain-containing protein [bacterium SCSIO 12741]|nr:DUF11 domain-containing protein [bacterium SCSIO 12741]